LVDVPYDVQGVLFDLDDTLLDHSAAAAAAILRLVRSVPDWTEDDAATVIRWQDLETEHFARYAAGEISMIQQRRARIRSFLALADAADEVLDERFDAYLRSYREGWRAIPGGPEVVLRLLDEGYRVGVLTNGQGAQQRAKLAAIGLTDARLVVCVSEELPAAKPAPAAYESACHSLGLAPDQVLMVGDHRTNDVDGARAAGLHAVHISPGASDRRTAEPDDGVETIASVTELRLRPARRRGGG
jgi:putative hydrolase of the HAD superfamily